MRSALRAPSPVAALLGLTVGALLMLALATPASAAARLAVDPSGPMTDGMSITVTGSGFSPGMTQIAVGQCVEGFQGPAECNLAGGAQFVNADASGAFGPVTLKVMESFSSYDCTRQSCVIAAQVLPSAGDADTVAANTSVMPITFAAPSPAPTAPAPDSSPDPAPAGGAGEPSPATTEGAPDDGALASTGPVAAPFLALSGSGLVLPGIGLLLLIPAAGSVLHNRRGVTR